MDEKLQIVLKKIAEVVYEQYIKDLKYGNIRISDKHLKSYRKICKKGVL